jgi:hypothetical protein
MVASTNASLCFELCLLHAFLHVHVVTQQMWFAALYAVGLCLCLAYHSQSFPTYRPQSFARLVQCSPLLCGFGRPSPEHTLNVTDALSQSHSMLKFEWPPPHNSQITSQSFRFCVDPLNPDFGLLRIHIDPASNSTTTARRHTSIALEVHDSTRWVSFGTLKLRRIE